MWCQWVDGNAERKRVHEKVSDHNHNIFIPKFAVLLVACLHFTNLKAPMLRLIIVINMIPGFHDANP